MLRRTCYAGLLAGLLASSACVAEVHGTIPLGGDDGDATGSDTGAGSGSEMEEPARTTITVNLFDRPADPLAFGMLVAVRDGDGPWKVAPPGETFTFDVASSTWGIAWTCTTVSVPTVVFGYFSTAETTSYTRTIHPACTDAFTPMRSLSGTVTNMPSSTATWSARHGAIGTDVVRASSTSVTGTFSFATAGGVADGPHDLVLSRTLLSATASGRYVSKAAIVRDVVAPTSTMAVDWATSGIKVASFSYSGVTATQQFSTILHTASDTVVDFGSLASSVPSNVGTFESSGLSDAQAEPGDVYVQQLRLSNTSLSAVLERWSETVKPRTLTSPAPFGTVLARVGTTSPYPKLEVQWTPYPDAAGYTFTSMQSRSEGSVMWNASVGAGYLGTTPKVEVPDLSALPGWDRSLEIMRGVAINGEVSAIVSTDGIEDVPFRATAPAGTERMFVSRSYSVIP